MSIVKHVTLQKIVAHDFRYDPRIVFLSFVCVATLNGEGKGKTISVYSWTGPEGSRRMRLPDFKAFGT